jgi:hypothetical protein
MVFKPGTSELLEHLSVPKTVFEPNSSNLARIRLFPTHGFVEKANRAFSDRNIKIVAPKDKLEGVQRRAMLAEKSDLIPSDDKLVIRLNSISYAASASGFTSRLASFVSRTSACFSSSRLSCNIC